MEGALRGGLTIGQEMIETLVEMLVSYGVVCQRAADGELLLELYSLLECLQPEEHGLPERLRQLRLVPTRTTALGLYLIYIPLPDALVHLIPASTLPEVHTWRRGLRPDVLPSQATVGHPCAGLRVSLPGD